MTISSEHPGPLIAVLMVVGLAALVLMLCFDRK